MGFQLEFNSLAHLV
jgi:hypothetical protein